MTFLAHDTAQHWRERATEVRRLADMLHGETERQHMLSCARMYDRLAEMADKRDGPKPLR